MDIKPLYETGTIKFVNPTIKQATKLEKVKKVNAEYSNIPKGIIKVIQWEKYRQLFTLGVTFALFVASIIMIILYIKVFDSSWAALIIPTLVGMIGLYKFTTTYQERRYIINSVKRYSEDLKIGITSTPAFIAKLYRQLIQKQIRHNWFTFVVIFYGGISTLLLWWLKDFTWWFLRFDKWIHAWFSNPNLMTILFTIMLISIVAIHLVLAVQRKRKLLEIDSYFGTTVMPQVDINSIKESENKMLRRLFIISLIVVLVIPLVVKLMLKLLRRK